MISFWMDEALTVEGRPAPNDPLVGDARCDVCIVGGGYTGLWTALRIKEIDPGATVKIIEADICGRGGSGRNCGFLQHWGHKAPKMLELAGQEEGRHLLKLSQQAVDEIGAFCGQNNIDAQYRKNGWIWLATNAAQAAALERTVREFQALGMPLFEELNAQDAATKTGTLRSTAALFDPQVATVQPALLVRGLRRLALARGIEIHERTPMTSLRKGTTVRVSTPKGTITADVLVLGLETWAAELKEFRRDFVVISADALMTDPIPEHAVGQAMRAGAAMSDSRIFLNAFRMTPSGRLNYSKGTARTSFGNRVGERFDGPSSVVGALREELSCFYPGLRGIGFASSWRGSVSRTRTGLPFFGRLPKHPNVLFAHGYSGSGVGPSFVAGRALASLALAQRSEWLESAFVNGPFSLFPPEPIRYFGGLMVRGAIARRERAEDVGQKSKAIDRLIGRFAPIGLEAPADE